MTELIAVADNGEWCFDGEERAALTASAIPVKPPKAWFEDPKLTEPTALTVTPEGRVYGHAAAWGVRHIGLPGCRTAPRSQTNYRHYRTGAVETDDGSMVATGRLSFGGGHADVNGDLTAAVQHYDDVTSAVADLACGEDEHGLWMAGALRPDVTPEQVRALRASSVSGDWRSVDGRGLELCGILAVNVPGFSVPRANLAASGAEVTSLVAAGAIRPTITIRTTPIEENTVSETVETPAETTETVTASAPSFAKDQVVRIPADAALGLVASVDGDRAVVQVEVPVAELVDAGPEGRAALSASARERVMDSRLDQALGKIAELQSSMEAMVASAAAEREVAEAKLRGADALSVLDGIPAGQ